MGDQPLELLQLLLWNLLQVSVLVQLGRSITTTALLSTSRAAEENVFDAEKSLRYLEALTFVSLKVLPSLGPDQAEATD